MACDNLRREHPGPFDYGQDRGVNTNPELEEASGLAASSRYPGCVWTHNDSGHPAELFLLDSTAKTIGTWRLTGIRNRDWEDIAIGPGRDSTRWLYVGDIGDNNSRYPVKIIYCLPEPSLAQQGEVTVTDTLFIRLADRTRDTEALLVDPITHNLYLVSKREKKGRVYEVTYPFLADTLVAQHVLTLPMTRVVAGDISRDGSEILLKSYEAIYYWKRSVGQSIPDALAMTPTELAYEQEPLGEAIAWANDGSCYYTLGENGKGERSRLYRYPRKVPR